MNAETKILAALPDLAQATERANGWVSIARPIIRAIFALEEIEHLLTRERFTAEKDSDSRTFKEATGYIAKPQRELREMLDGIRDDFLADEMPPQPSQGAPDSEWEARDEFSDALGESVTSVDQAIKIVTDEHNASFGL